MLLRRVKHHIVNENWFAVFVDFVIVVVGVYVGIEVSNWNEARQEDQRAQEYLERIHADLLNDMDAAVGRREFWARVVAYGDAAIRHAETGELYKGSAAMTLLAYYQASQVDPYASVATTYEELKAAGELRLIRNAELRSRLAKYYVYATSLQAEHLFQYMPQYREYVRGVVPREIQSHVWRECHDTVNNMQTLIDCELPVDEAQALALIESLARDATAVRGLRFWITNLGVASLVLADNLVETEKLLGLVERELPVED